MDAPRFLVLSFYKSDFTDKCLYKSAQIYFYRNKAHFYGYKFPSVIIRLPL